MCRQLQPEKSSIAETDMLGSGTSSSGAMLARNIKEIDTVVVGGMFACIPLLIELDKSNNSYVIISNLYNGKYNSIWREMESQNRLYFDLVSSLHTSYYSYDLVNESSQDRYPTSKEFHQYQKNHLKKYENDTSKMIDGKVIKIDNFENYSIVHYICNKTSKTSDSTVNNNVNWIKCKHVVLGTGFKRAIHKELTNFNPNVMCNQTIVITTLTDSTNMLIARLIARKMQYIIK